MRSINSKDSAFVLTENLIGENRATAALGLVLTLSPGAAGAFCQLVAEAFGKPMSSRITDIRLEEPTTLGSGAQRIDMLIVTEDYKIVVETKILHTLGSHQPSDYLRAIGGLGGNHCAVVIVPDQKRAKNEPILSAQGLGKSACMLTWQEVLDAILRANIDTTVRYLVGELRRLVDFYLGTLSNLAGSYERIFGEAAEKTLQTAFVGALKPVFEIGSPPAFWPSIGKTWIGHNFAALGDEAAGWYGLVRRSAITPGGAGTADRQWRFVIGLSKRLLSLTTPALGNEFVRLPSINGWNDSYWSAWSVTVTPEQLSDENKWEVLMRPVIEAVAAAVERATSVEAQSDVRGI